MGICIIGLSFVAGCAGHMNGCSSTQETPSTPQHVIKVPTNFIKQIASADHVIVRPRNQDPLLKDLSLTLTGKKAKDIVRAIALLKNDVVVGVGYPPCDCENWKLQFYQGTNCLGVALFVEDVVDINGEYHDYTGTLKKIDKEINDKMQLFIPAN